MEILSDIENRSSVILHIGSWCVREYAPDAMSITSCWSVSTFSTSTEQGLKPSSSKLTLPWLLLFLLLNCCCLLYWDQDLEVWPVFSLDINFACFFVVLLRVFTSHSSFLFFMDSSLIWVSTHRFLFNSCLLISTSLTLKFYKLCFHLSSWLAAFVVCFLFYSVASKCATTLLWM